jgi:transcription elongation factor/antiterminator RfaH
MTSSTWHVAETRPRAEVLAQANLERQGFACFCPRFRKTRRHARRVESLLAPVFPGYIFITFDPRRDHWSPINGTTGVRRLVGSAAGAPYAMPESVMSALFERCEGSVIQRMIPTLALGQQVRMASGPFATALATIESLDDHGRVRVLLDILGGSVPTRVHMRDLEPA